jgi:hypothetical protein
LVRLWITESSGVADDLELLFPLSNMGATWALPKGMSVHIRGPDSNAFTSEASVGVPSRFQVSAYEQGPESSAVDKPGRERSEG